jgi:hypothetical protein
MCLRRDEGSKAYLQQHFLSASDGINAEQCSIIKIYANDNMMAAASSTENKVYRVQQKLKQ